jgi:RNA-directed DNA polymerase
MKTKLNFITEKARENKRLKFTSLMHHMNGNNLVACYDELNKYGASGVDGVTVEEYGKELGWNILQLVEQLKTKTYRPQPVKRVYIPKAGKPNEKRGLGIPTIEDKLVQIMLKKILEAIFETDFSDISHGFRPEKSCHTAIKELNSVVMKRPVNFIVEVDIKKFFDTIKHYWMLRCLEERISDPNVLRLVKRILEAGVMENGNYQASDLGSPQGGVVSPLLANIYLHYVLDMWFERVIQPKARGFMQMIRYADDFVVCCESERDAKEFLSALEERFSKFGLELSPEKTRIIKFGRHQWKLNRKTGNKSETFNFLGFTHYCGTSRGGYFMMGHKTSKENLNRKLASIKKWIKGIRNLLPLKEWWPKLEAKLTGHYNYFGISGNYRCLNQYYRQVVSVMFKWINRRSQRKSMTLEFFSKYLEWNPLPKPKICFALYASSNNAIKVNVSAKSRVRENCKHGSAGGILR